MNEEKKFTKLSALVNDSFTVERAFGFQYKAWDNESKRMLVEEKWRQGMREEGFRKIYSLETDKGKLDVSASQLGQMLEGAYDKGVSDIRHKTFNVKSNGKEGMEIRYYINIDYKASQEQKPATEPQNAPQRQPESIAGAEEISMDDIPF